MKRRLIVMTGMAIISALFIGGNAVEAAEKPGYRLIFEDNFEETVLNENNFVTEYLPSWASDPLKAEPIYRMQDGKIKLTLEKDTEPWCPEYDGDTRVSGFMTGRRDGLHNWTGKNDILNHVEKKISNITQYGYFELRAKMQKGGGIHTAWWLTGFEDSPEQSAEIDLFEILGRDVNEIVSTKHPWKDEQITYETKAFRPKNVDLADEFHNYGFEWDAQSMKFYFDGQLYAEMKSDVHYPLITLLSFYEKRAAGAWTGPFDPTVPYPKSFDIDYLRIYKKIPKGYQAVANDQLAILNQDEQKLVVASDMIVVENSEIKGTPSWVTVRYNDGTDTQEAVLWQEPSPDQLTELKQPGGKITIKGKLNTTSLPAKFKGYPVELTVISK